jgi:hypothetical protein
VWFDLARRRRKIRAIGISDLVRGIERPWTFVFQSNLRTTKLKNLLSMLSEVMFDFEERDEQR